MKNEKLTRKEIIDNRLKQADWNVTDRTQVIEEFDIHLTVVEEPATPYAGHQYSDYVLLGKDGKPLAVVEAKKTSVDAAIGREQAKQYCYNIQSTQGGELPFCFYTNGHDIYFWDLDNYPPKKVYGFPTRDDLERYSYIRKARKQLAGELINTKIAGRNYQIASIRAVMEAIEKRKRKFLLVMATGTGKTRTCIALVDALMRAGWAERVLFLVDRIALRDQTLEAFKEHLPNEPRWAKQSEKEIATDRRIYVSTYPTMLNVIRNEDKSLSPHFFDLIVVDESHRSIYNTYQEILDNFNTITLGLTATPTDVIDHNTFQLFECEDGVPTLPRIAISVDMLDTGIDVRELVNLVFAKPVYSYTKFWQMIGRGTRLLEPEKIKPWCTQKDNFLILDCWDNFEYFKLNPRGKELKEQIPLPVRLFGVRLEKIEEAQSQIKSEIVNKEILKIKKQVESLPKNSVVIMEAKHELQRLEDENFWNNLTADKMEFLEAVVKPLLRTVYNHRKAALVQFIKHILGIEQLETFAETVTKAFDDFISKHSYLTSRQLQFLDLLKNFVLEKGDVSKRNLIESPFTMLHPEGIRGIFNQKEIDEILSLTEKVLAA